MGRAALLIIDLAFGGPLCHRVGEKGSRLSKKVPTSKPWVTSMNTVFL